LIITFLVSRARSVSGPTAEVLNINITSIITFILLFSSLTMVLALEAFQHDNIRQGQLWLTATIVLGVIFVGTQIYEYTELVHEGLTLTGNLFGSAFYTLTGFHGTHVFIGVLLLLTLLLMSTSGKLNARNSLPVELIGLYWHFVDLVWLVIFTLVYLLT
jgi:heme/copper-type cytochrome/quinol oxidase subunit 3